MEIQRGSQWLQNQWMYQAVSYESADFPYKYHQLWLQSKKKMYSKLQSDSI